MANMRAETVFWSLCQSLWSVPTLCTAWQVASGNQGQARTTENIDTFCHPVPDNDHCINVRHNAARSQTVTNLQNLPCSADMRTVNPVNRYTLSIMQVSDVNSSHVTHPPGSVPQGTLTSMALKLVGLLQQHVSILTYALMSTGDWQKCLSTWSCFPSSAAHGPLIAWIVEAQCA